MIADVMHCRKFFIQIFFALLFFMQSIFSFAQVRNDSDTSHSIIGYDSQGRLIKKDTTNQTLQHRNPLEDSITISYHFFDSSRVHKLDSSINDFYARFPVPYYYVDLGNLGNAAHSLIFSPYMKPGWDAGFHAYDIYLYKIENTKFFTTTRPYTELNYLIGSQAEQLINILTTQNRKSNFNYTFEFRFFNSPGAFRSQNVSHTNIRFNTQYISSDKRYGNYFIFINNKINSSENGGLQDKSKLDSSLLGSVFETPVKLGDSSSRSNNFFFNQYCYGQFI